MHISSASGKKNPDQQVVFAVAAQQQPPTAGARNFRQKKNRFSLSEQKNSNNIVKIFHLLPETYFCNNFMTLYCQLCKEVRKKKLSCFKRLGSGGSAFAKLKLKAGTCNIRSKNWELAILRSKICHQSEN